MLIITPWNVFVFWSSVFSRFQLPYLIRNHQTIDQILFRFQIDLILIRFSIWCFGGVALSHLDFGMEIDEGKCNSSIIHTHTSVLPTPVRPPKRASTPPHGWCLGKALPYWYYPQWWKNKVQIQNIWCRNNLLYILFEFFLLIYRYFTYDMSCHAYSSR